MKGDRNSGMVVQTADGRCSDWRGRIPIVAEGTYAAEDAEPHHDFVGLSTGG